jgi:uncharacterized protein (TIGR03067 family)
MNLRLLALSVIMLIPLGAAPAEDDAVKKELAKMEGEWQVVRGEEDGKAVSEYVVEHLQWHIKGDQLTFKGIQPLTDKASKLTIKIDTSSTPRCIDFKVEAGSEKGGVLEGIYEWQRDELKLCLFLNFNNRNRPVEFETRDGSNRVLFVLKRQSP